MSKHKRQALPRGRHALERWVSGNAGNLVVTRGQVVGVLERWLGDRVVPLIADCIKLYEKERRRRVWFRRFWRWLGRKLLRDPQVEPMVQFLDGLDAEMQEAAEDLADEVEAAAPVNPRTCVVCGSAALEPVNEHGGLKCDRGHILEEPAAAAGEPAPVGVPEPAPTQET